MHNKSWQLKTKRDIKTKSGRSCSDCKKPILPGSFARRFTYQKRNEEKGFMMYDNKFVCEECEKYWRDKEPKHEEN